jgi:hypothetical protein
MALAELVPEAPEIERNVELVHQASHDGAYRLFWRLLRQMTPTLQSAAERAEKNWFDLPDAAQDELIRLKEGLDNIFQLPQPSVPMVARVRDLLSDEERKVSWLFAGAVSRFNAAVERALREQYQQQQTMLEKMGSEPALVAEIARGEAEFRARQGTRFSPKEFKKRFSLT